MRKQKEGVEKLADSGGMYTASSPHLPQMFRVEQLPSNSEKFGGTWSKSTQESYLLPRNTMMEGHSEVLCLGIWEDKMQMAREGHTSEIEKAND